MPPKTCNRCGDPRTAENCRTLKTKLKDGTVSERLHPYCRPCEKKENKKGDQPALNKQQLKDGIDAMDQLRSLHPNASPFHLVARVVEMELKIPVEKQNAAESQILDAWLDKKPKTAPLEVTVKITKGAAPLLKEAADTLKKLSKIENAPKPAATKKRKTVALKCERCSESFEAAYKVRFCSHKCMFDNLGEKRERLGTGNEPLAENVSKKSTRKPGVSKNKEEIDTSDEDIPEGAEKACPRKGCTTVGRVDKLFGYRTVRDKSGREKIIPQSNCKKCRSSKKK